MAIEKEVKIDTHINQNKEQKNFIIDDTSKKVTQTINILNDIIQLYSFLKIGDLGDLYIEQSNTSFSKSGLINMISHILNSNLGFKGLDYKALESLIYNQPINKETIKIANGIKKTNSIFLEKMYNGNFEDVDGDLFLTFPNFENEGLDHIKRLYGEERFKSINLDLNFDDLFSYIWSEKGIKYGFEYDFLRSENFSGLKREDLNLKTIKVASSKKVINNTADEIELGENIKLLKIPKKTKNGSIDTNIFEYFFPQAKKMDKILTIKIGQKGKNGIDIHGKTINYEENFKLDLKKFISEGNEYIGIKSEKDTEGNQIYTLIAKENIYINLIKNNRSSHELRDYKKGKIVGIIAGKEEIVNTIDIGMDTKNMEVKNLAEFHQKGNIEKGYYLEGENILLSSSNVLGKVTSKQNMFINGQSNICNGFLQSINGNISISEETKVHTNTTIFAMNGNIIVNGDIEQSTIIGNEITINGSAVGINCIAKKIIINGTTKLSKIKGENITINKDLGNNEIVLIIYYAIEKFKRHLELTKNNKGLFLEKIESIDIDIKSKEKTIKNLENLTSKSEDYYKENLNPGDLYKLKKEIEILKSQKKILLDKVLKDDDYSSRIKVFLEQFEKDTKDYIGNIASSSIESDIRIYPTGFIYDDKQYTLLNPNDINTRQKEKILFLDSLMKHNFKKDKKITNLKNSEPFYISYEQLYKSLIENLKSSNIYGNIDLECNKEDIKRFHVLKIKPSTFFEHFHNKKISESDAKRFNITKVSIDSFAGCFLNDISLKGGSFIVHKNISLYEKDSICEVKFNLKTDNNILEINSYFWITNLVEIDNYKKISGFFLDPKTEGILLQYFNYLDIKMKRRT